MICIIAQLLRNHIHILKMPSYLSLCVNLYTCSCSYQFVLLGFRAIYFAAYSKAKEAFNGLLVPNSGVVHMSSAGVAGEQSAC